MKNTHLRVLRGERRYVAYSDTMKAYLRSLSNYPTISEEEDRQLAYRIRDGDHADESGVHGAVNPSADCRTADAALQRLVCTKLHLVLSAANRYATLLGVEGFGQTLELEDLVQEGNMALIEAAHHYDPERQASFTTFAMPFVRKAILQALEQQDRIVRLPNRSTRMLHDMRLYEQRFLQQHERLPTDSELADALGTRRSTISFLEGVRRTSVSLQHTQTDHADGEALQLQDVLSDRSLLSPEERLDLKARL